MTYREKLLDPRWQKKRLDIFNRDAFTCTMCGATDKTLHVHHKYYEYEREPWDYPAEALTTLCMDCHEAEGAMKVEVQSLIKVLLKEDYTYQDLYQLLVGLGLPLEMDKEERVRYGYYCISNLHLLQQAKAETEKNFKDFIEGI